MPLRRPRVPYTRPGLRGRPALRALAGLVAAVAAATAWAALRALKPPPAPERNPPSAYRITYLVTDPQGPSRQVLSVRRPYEGRNEVTGPDGHSSGLLTTADRAVRLRDGRAVEDLGPKAPSTAAGDARPLLALPAALREGLARTAGGGRVGGRPCRRFSVAEPPGHPLSPPGPIATTELCVDDRGLILEERQLSGGRLVRSRVAVRVEPAPPDASFDIPAGLPARPEPATLTISPPEADAQLASLPPSGPPGFRLDRSLLLDQPGSRTLIRAWVRGPDLLLAEVIRSPARPWNPAPFARPALAGGQPAEVVLDLVASQLRMRLRSGWWLRLSGTVPPDLLVRWAALLTESFRTP